MKVYLGCRKVAAIGGLVWLFVGCDSADPSTSPAPLVANERHVLPPRVRRMAVQKPRSLVADVESAPDTGASALSGVVVDARALVITTDGTDSAYSAVTQTLQYLGAPFDVLNATTGPTLTADSLATGTHGKYDAVFLDLGGLEKAGGSAFTNDEWTTLATYEAQFSVRRVALYTSPSAAYGLSDNGSIDPSQTPVTMTCTAAGSALFVGTNCVNPIVMSDGWAYPAAATDSSTTPLLVDASGNIFAALRQYPDGREAVALTFAQATYLTTYLELAYGLVSWATRGLFVGERHVYVVPQIDDFFLASVIYTGGTYRINDADLQALADWQSVTRTRLLLGGFQLAWAVNGQGSQSMPGDPLTAKALALGPTFSWINHSWDHPILDGLSYADVLSEFMRNDTFLRGLGLAPYATVNAVTPSISGLESSDAMQAIHDVGIRQIVSDTSVSGEDNPSPNAGLWNALQPTVLEIPRLPTNLDYDASQPAEWAAWYEATLTGGAAVDYPTMIDHTSDDLLRAMLTGSNDPWMFHQANTRDYDGKGDSLLSDLLTATFDKYAAAATFPIESPTMDDLAGRVTRRMTFDASGVTATIAPQASLTVSVSQAAIVPVTGLCTPGAETYGGQTISYLALGAGQSVTLSLAGCNPGYGTGGTGGAAGAAGMVGSSGAGGGGAGAGGTAGIGSAPGTGGQAAVDAGASGAAGTSTGGVGGEGGEGGSTGTGTGGTTGAAGTTETGGAGHPAEGSGGAAGSPPADASATGGNEGLAGAAGGGGVDGRTEIAPAAGAGCSCGVSDGRPSGGLLLLGFLGLLRGSRRRAPIVRLCAELFVGLRRDHRSRQ